MSNDVATGRRIKGLDGFISFVFRVAFASADLNGWSQGPIRWWRLSLRLADGPRVRRPFEVRYREHWRRRSASRCAIPQESRPATCPARPRPPDLLP